MPQVTPMNFINPRAAVLLAGLRAGACKPAACAAAQVDELSVVADKYRGTLEENRRLYNEVQDLKGNIRVFCRVRPPGATGDATPSAPPTVPRVPPPRAACGPPCRLPVCGRAARWGPASSLPAPAPLARGARRPLAGCMRM